MKSPTSRAQRPRRRITRAQRVRLQSMAALRRRAPVSASRREFLKQGAGVGLVMGLPPLLAACGGDDDPAPAAPPGKHLRTLFFNLSHEQHAGKTYYLTGGGQRLALTPVAEQPQVLQAARQRNAFLRAVADDQITHHVEDAVFADDSVTLCYVSADIDAQAGTWSMSSVQMYIPPAGAAQAYAAARSSAADGALRLSAKRRRYGVQAARSAQDLSDERELLDTTSHAATMVGCHPDLLSLEPNSAHTVYSNHIDYSIDVVLLDRNLSKYGPATPQQTAGQPNASGWATLQPVLGDDGVPLKNDKGQHKDPIAAERHTLATCLCRRPEEGQRQGRPVLPTPACPRPDRQDPAHQALARHQLRTQSHGHGDEPARTSLPERLRRCHALNFFARNKEVTAKESMRDPEHLQPFRRQPAAPAKNRPEIVRSRQHRRQRQYQDRGKFITTPLPRPVVRHPLECGPKRSHQHHPLQGERAWNPHRARPQCGGLNHPALIVQAASSGGHNQAGGVIVLAIRGLRCGLVWDGGG